MVPLLAAKASVSPRPVASRWQKSVIENLKGEAIQFSVDLKLG